MKDHRVRKGDYLAEQATPRYIAYVLRAAINYDIAELSGETGAGDIYDEIIDALRMCQGEVKNLIKAFKQIEQMEYALGLEPEMPSLDKLMRKVSKDFEEANK
ncbi:MAG: hypothetical protein ACOX8Q_01835 [Christensenellales bacterium]|jgi:hypothetical protein